MKVKIHPQEPSLNELYEIYETLELSKELDVKKAYAISKQIERHEAILRQSSGVASEV